MRPGHLVHAEHEARDHAERAGWYDERHDPEPLDGLHIEDALMARIRAGAHLMHEQQRREEHWREAMRGRV